MEVKCERVINLDFSLTDEEKESVKKTIKILNEVASNLDEYDVDLNTPNYCGDMLHNGDDLRAFGDVLNSLIDKNYEIC